MSGRSEYRSESRVGVNHRTYTVVVPSAGCYRNGCCHSTGCWWLRGRRGWMLAHPHRSRTSAERAAAGGRRATTARSTAALPGAARSLARERISLTPPPSICYLSDPSPAYRPLLISLLIYEYCLHLCSGMSCFCRVCTDLKSTSQCRILFTQLPNSRLIAV